MKTLILKIFFLFFFFTTFSQAQNWIKDYDGIPIHTGLWMDWSNVPGALDSMSRIVDVVSADIGIVDGVAKDPLAQIDTLRNHGLKLIPVRTRTNINSTIYNWIQHYNDAKYCIWEAEGTSPGSGDATLEHNLSVMTEFTDGDTTYLKLNTNAAGLSDTNLIWGPYYVQDAVYYASQDSITDVTYRADFRLKLDYNNGIPNMNDNPDDSVCVIQVTYSTPLGTQGLACTYIVKEDTIIRSELKNYFVDFSLIYKLNAGDCDASRTNEIPQQNTFHSSTRRDTLLPGPRNSREYVEFRVVWLGKPQYLLSIDKITVSDQRGRDITNPASDAGTNILAQANTSDSLNADTVIVGWLGIDEPVSIDIFEPIKLVTQLLDDNSQNKQPLWLALMGKWDGAFRDRGDIHGAMGLSPWTEMKKRIGNMNVWQDFYLYDYPCNKNSSEPVCQGDWRSTNIWRMAELNYKQAYELNPNFGVSLQCGEVHNTQAYERNIGPHELLYNANIALMYGAKFISLYSYFAQRNIDSCLSGWICHAIVDIDPVDGHLIYTPKYSMLKNKLKPRLDGLFGKTIKTLTPLDQFVGPDGINYYPPSPPEKLAGGYLYVEDIFPPVISQYDEYGLDLGFFNDPGDLEKKFFMILNRYYSAEFEYQIYLRNLETFINWRLTNYVDSTSIYLKAVDSKSMFTDTLLNGDANLYSILPVVKYGGKLVYSETVSNGTTLYEDMTIESGATLIVNGTYNANANITVKSGGKIVAGQNAMINFGSDKKLIVEGIVEVKGTSENNNLTIVAGIEKAILVKSGSAFTLNYCTILAPHTGIETETGIQSYVNISNTQITATRTGISLIGGSQENRTSSTPPFYDL